MRGITLWQPYASLIAIGAKTIETRSWGTGYRGPLLIHASKKWDGLTMDACAHARAELHKHRFRPVGEAGKVAGLPWVESLGHVLAIARLVDCREMPHAFDPLNAAFGAFGPGRYGWVLADVAPLDPPVPWKGMQGLWGVPEKLRGWVAGSMTSFPLELEALVRGAPPMEAMP